MISVRRKCVLGGSTATEGLAGLCRRTVAPNSARPRAMEHRYDSRNSSSYHGDSLKESETWISTVKKETHTKIMEQNQMFGGMAVEWDDDNSWTPFITEVANLLYLEGKSQKVIVHTAAGLVRYGVTNKEKLVSAAGTPPDGELFNRKLEAKGVPAAMCDKLFKKYILNIATVEETGRLPLFC